MARGRPKGIAKTGGRQKGTPNRASVARQKEIAASGLTPLDYMLKVMRDLSAPPDRRDEMAKAAAPYVHPKLSAVEHAGRIDSNVTITDGRDKLARLIAGQASAGEVADDRPTTH